MSEKEKDKNCILCYPEGNITRMIKGYEYDGKKPWVFVPREPEAFGHLIVAAGKHYTDISDKGLATNEGMEHLKQIMSLISKLSLKMKEKLKFDEKECEKIYVATLCETENMHLHFHLIPKFKGDRQGFLSLFEKELDGARWMLKGSTEEDRILEGYHKVHDTEAIAEFHKIKAKIEELLLSQEMDFKRN